eukprot:7157643-Lingulodinium_polyedra.AAC.1
MSRYVKAFGSRAEAVTTTRGLVCFEYPAVGGGLFQSFRKETSRTHQMQISSFIWGQWTDLTAQQLCAATAG